MKFASLFALAREFKKRLLKREDKALAELRDAYSTLGERLHSMIDDIAAQMDASGDYSRLEWLKRLNALRSQVQSEMNKLSAHAEAITTTAQRASVSEGEADALSMMNKIAEASPRLAASFLNLPVGAFEQIVGFTQGGSPLRDSFNFLASQLGAQTEDAIVGEVQTGVALGWNVKKIASRIKQAIRGDNGISHDSRAVRRLSTTVTTATLQAYREANLETYRANSRVVKGWRWLSARTINTCPVCWALDGREFPPETPFSSHPNCKCTPIPILQGETHAFETGDSLFSKLSDAQQSEILGKGKYEAYKAGKLRLADLVGEREDEIWGKMYAERNLKDATRKTSRLKLSPSNNPDPFADRLAKRIGGVSRVIIDGFGNKEFDAVSDVYIAETFNSEMAADPKRASNFLKDRRRAQIRKAFEAAGRTKRVALFEFTNGAPSRAVIEFLEKTSRESGVSFDVIIG